MRTGKTGNRRKCHAGFFLRSGGAFLIAGACTLSEASGQYLQKPTQPAPVPGSASAQERDMDNWYFVMNRDLPSGAIAVTLMPGARSAVRLTGNYDGRQEIGDYGVLLPAAGPSRVRDLARSSGYRRLPQPKTLAATMPTVSLGEGEAGGAAATMPILATFSLDAVPPETTLLFQAVEEQVEEIRKHPLRVLQGSARPESTRFPAGGLVSFAVTFKNPGTEPLRLRNPCLARSPRDTGFELALRKLSGARKSADAVAASGEGEADSEPADDHATVALAPSEISLLPSGMGDEVDAERAAATWIELLPEDSIEFRLVRSAWLQVDSYEAVVVFSSPEPGKPDRRVIVGRLAMKAGVFETVPSDRR